MFGRNIANYRKARGLSQVRLAEKLDLTQSAIASWENDRTVPSGENLIRLSDILGVSVETLTSSDTKVTQFIGHPIDDSGYAALPYYGKIHAGDPIEAIEDKRLYQVPIDVRNAHKDGFVLLVEGECMNRVYPNGCHVVVDPNIYPESGQVGAFLIDGEVVMRRVFKGAGKLMLSPDSFDETIEDIIISHDCSEVTSLGRIVWFQASEEI